jgi:hypothetical protein
MLQLYLWLYGIIIIILIKVEKCCCLDGSSRQ